MEGGNEKLEQEEARVAIDMYQVFPAQSYNIDGTRDSRERMSRTFAGSDEGICCFGSEDEQKQT